jgi:putative SOS response-associated peptidase YedK
MESFTIITTTPNDVLARFHDRMPVILPERAQQTWLAEEAGDDDLLAVLKPLPDGSLRARPVNPRLNSTANDDPSCIAPPPTGPAPGDQLGFDFPPAS